MTRPNPKTAERMRYALELIVSNLEHEIGRARARVGSLVASVAADAQMLTERHKHEGADAVSTTFVAMRVRDLVAAETATSGAGRCAPNHCGARS